MAQFGITVRRGAMHNSIAQGGMVRDLSDMDTEQRKANERAARKGIVALYSDDFGNKPGSDRRKARRARKGWKS